jgi:hypothetical protein
MKTLKQFILEHAEQSGMFVIGHRRTYDKNIAQSRENIQNGYSEMPPLKLGLESHPDVKYDKGYVRGDIHPDEAGAVFPSIEHARDAIAKHWPEKRTRGIPGQKEMAVYRVKGTFGPHSTYFNNDTGFHHLRHDAEILHRID